MATLETGAVYGNEMKPDLHWKKIYVHVSESSFWAKELIKTTFLSSLSRWGGGLPKERNPGFVWSKAFYQETGAAFWSILLISLLRDVSIANILEVQSLRLAQLLNFNNGADQNTNTNRDEAEK